MLHEFLIQNKNEILKLSHSKTKQLAGLLANSTQLELGLPLFFDQLCKILEFKIQRKPSEALMAAAAEHGKEFLRLGYSLSHVVHSYGALCQAITELATLKNAKITSNDFNILNSSLDIAIASAVSEFQFRSVQANDERELQHLGFLAHELRNALSSATVAHDMIKAGLVGTGGSTASVLEVNLARMRNLIDRSLSEVRMRADADVFIETFRLTDFFDQILLTANVDAEKKKIALHCQVDWELEVESDRQFLMSAVANIVQNAIKYTKSNGKVDITATLLGDKIQLAVADECGGIEESKVSLLFEPYNISGHDKSGLGLGLTISKQAVYLCQGEVFVQNFPGHGCKFIIEIPQKMIPGPSNKVSVPGIKSVQPKVD